jgi:23S rRNA (uracil1939-C5)-methyltransferase
VPDGAADPVRILKIGHKGDGETDDGRFVPLTAPGDLVEAEWIGGQGRLIRIVEASSERQTPPCIHFGDCGGCALQHWQDSRVAEWKRGLIIEALAQRGLTGVDVATTRTVSRKSRRRAELHARQTGAGVEAGFHQRGDNRIVDMAECHILPPQLSSLVPRLRLALVPLLPSQGQATIYLLAADNGVDMGVGKSGLTLGIDERHEWVAMARQLGVLRLSVNGETLAEFEAPRVAIDGVTMNPPPDAFLQASSEAEKWMQAWARDGLKGASKIIDLFSGCGTFALAMARNAAIHAVDSDAKSIATLAKAVRGAQGLKTVTTETRDLFRRPVIAHDLNKFDAVIVDPPRSGAKAQTEMLAQSKVPLIAAISCNPATFARDARILADGGYRLASVTPIDQFLWSAHVELTALFERK